MLFFHFVKICVVLYLCISTLVGSVNLGVEPKNLVD